MLDIATSPLAAFEDLVFQPRQQSPIWQQIYDHILNLIETGRLAPGEQLPGETHIASKLGVTRVTLRSALQQLQKEGHLTARKGVGIFVRNPPSVFSVRDGRPFGENIETHEGTVSTLTRFITREPASAEIAAKLRLSECATIIHLCRVRLINDQPIYVNHKYFPLDRFADFDAVYEQRHSVTDVFRAHDIAAFHRAETRISGGFATSEEAGILQLTPGTPVFRINARNEDGKGAAIEWTHGCWQLTSVEFVFGDSED